MRSLRLLDSASVAHLKNSLLQMLDPYCPLPYLLSHHQIHRHSVSCLLLALAQLISDLIAELLSFHSVMRIMALHQKAYQYIYENYVPLFVLRSLTLDSSSGSSICEKFLKPFDGIFVQ